MTKIAITPPLKKSLQYHSNRLPQIWQPNRQTDGKRARLSIENALRFCTVIGCIREIDESHLEFIT